MLKVIISFSDEKRKYLERLKTIICENIQNFEETESFSFIDGCKVEEEKMVIEENADIEEVIIFVDYESGENTDDDEVICLD